MATTVNCSICGAVVPAGHSGPRCPDCQVHDWSERYRVEEEIARGGMGVVFRATDVGLDRVVAMKVLQPHGGAGSSGGILRARFLEEARITAQLDHPGIVPVHEMGLDGEHRPFFTMRRVKGQELSRIFELARAEQDGWNPSRAVGAMVKACHAVAFAHERGVIHRDLKPANIMVGRLGEVYVMDWGLAKVTGRDDLRDLRVDPNTSVTVLHSDRGENADQAPDSPLVTMDGAIVGTPAYMSPEQAEGRIEDLDRTSDVYSLGAILYTLLTGRIPYVNPGARISPRTILGLVTRMPPAPILEVEPTAPRELAAICERAMARDPAERYDTALALAEDLQAFLDGRIVRAYRTGAFAELRAWVGRHRETSIVLALSALALLTLGLVMVLQERHRTADLGERLARQYLRRGQAECEDGRPNEGLHWFVRGLSACPPGEPDLRQSLRTSLELWARVCPSLLRVVDLPDALHDERVGLAAFTPDARQVVLVGSTGTGHVIDADTGRIQVSFEAGEAPSALVVGPRGERFVTGTSEGVAQVRSVATGQPVLAPLSHENGVSALALSEDGELLLTGCLDGTARLWSIGGEPTVLALLNHDRVVRSVAFGGDGELATGCGDGVARRWSAAGEPLGAPLSHDSSVYALAYGPYGRVLATGSQGEARLWSTETGLRSQMQVESVPRFLDFSPDGTQLLTGGSIISVRTYSTATGEPDGLTLAFDDDVNAITFTPDGRHVRVLVLPELFDWSSGVPIEPTARYPVEGLVWALAFVPGSDALATGGSEEKLACWPESGATPALEVPNLAMGLWSMEFSPDGALLALGYSSSGVRIVSWETGEIVAQLPHPAIVRAVAFSPDGELLATASFDGEARVFEWSTGALIVSFSHSDYVEDVDIAPDGDTVLTGCGDGKARLWSIRTGGQIGEAAVQGRSVLAAEFSPDGHLFAIGGRDQTARLWNVATGEPHGPLLEHETWVEDLAFSPDGELLVTGSIAGRARLWSTRTGEPVGPPLRHGSSIRSIAFDPTGSRIATGGDSGEVFVWTLLEGEASLPDDPGPWVESKTGLRMDEDGVTRQIETDEWRRLRARFARGAGEED